MTKLDIKDAYYSVPIKLQGRSFLKFMHKGKVTKSSLEHSGAHMEVSNTNGSPKYSASRHRTCWIFITCTRIQIKL